MAEMHRRVHGKGQKSGLVYQIKYEDKFFGPYSPMQVKSFAQEGRIKRQMSIRKLPDGKWYDVGDVPDLIPFLSLQEIVVPSPSQTAYQFPVQPQPIIEQPVPQSIIVSTANPVANAYYRKKYETSGAHSLGLASIIMGIVGLLLSWIPFFGLALPGVGFLLGIVGLFIAFSRRGSGIGFSIAGSMICFIALLPALFMTIATVAVVDTIDTAIKRTDSETTLKSEAVSSRSFNVEEWNQLVQKHNAHLPQKRFKIISASLKPQGDLFERSIINLSVKNGTPKTIKTAFFHAILKDPNRKIPYVNADFNYTIPGGLNPGETATWQLVNNAFDGDWRHATAENIKNSIFVVTVEQLEGIDDKVIYPVWTEVDQKRLDELKANRKN